MSLDIAVWCHDRIGSHSLRFHVFLLFAFVALPQVPAKFHGVSSNIIASGSSVDKRPITIEVSSH